MSSFAGRRTGEFDWSGNGETLEIEDKITYGATEMLALTQLSEAGDRRELTCSTQAGGRLGTIELRLRGATPLIPIAS